jgi:magnesium transporter
MAGAETLTLAFLSAHPARAARVLERLPGPEAAALFTRVPARVGGPVFAAMLPPLAARTANTLDDSAALALLTAVGAQAAVAVLRHVAEPRRTRLIEGLPTATAMASRLLLGSPEDAVGGWVDPDIIVLTPDSSAGEALARVRRGSEAEVEPLYVVDADQRLLGVVDLQALLRAPEATAVSALMREPPGALAATASLASAAAHEAWERAAVLPVLERGERLLGVLRRSVLRRALAHAEAAEPEAGEVTIVGVLAHGYWDAVSGLAEVALALLPRIEPVLPEEP